MMLTVIGGIYNEVCQEPQSNELYGSGLRGAAALANKGFDVRLKSCLGQESVEAANIICKTFGVTPSFEIIPETVTFHYYHPLSTPEFYPSTPLQERLTDTSAEYILMYGQIEATARVNGTYVVYDPQNWVRFSDTGSNADHLALVLNKKEALLLSGCTEDKQLCKIGRDLLHEERAEVVIIKNGSQGALVIEATGEVQEIPVFATASVWPIGSGDIFSAAFAWKWMVERLPAAEAALLASRYTAYYCERRVLPLPQQIKQYDALPISRSQKRIYLAGPFFTMAERWLICELRDALLNFGNSVFSPFHDVGTQGTAEQIAGKDLMAIQESDVLLAVVSGLDAGTMYEIGYARALCIKVVLIVENVSDNDLTMLQGSGCVITRDISTAIYQASW